MSNLIDIDATLQAMDEDPTVLIDLGDGSFLEILVDVPKQVRLIQKYIKPSKLALSPETFEKFQQIREGLGKAEPTPEELEQAIKGREAEFNFEVEQGQEDYYGLGVALVQYVQGWRGFKGDFSRDKVRKYLQRMSSIAEAFGKNCKKLLDSYEKHHKKVIEAEAKNS